MARQMGGNAPLMATIIALNRGRRRRLPGINAYAWLDWHQPTVRSSTMRFRGC